MHSQKKKDIPDQVMCSAEQLYLEGSNPLSRGTVKTLFPFEQILIVQLGCKQYNTEEVTGDEACNFIKKETLAQVFSC